MREDRAMKKPPVKKETQKLYVQSAVRFPPKLHQELHDAAKRNGRSMNAEVIARLDSTPIQTKLEEIIDGNNELKALIKQIIDQ